MRLNLARMGNDLCAHPARTAYILRLLHALLDEHPARKVIVLSDRRTHLTTLQAGLAPGVSGLYVGGMRAADLEASARCRVVLATYAMAAEGLDIRGLNACCLASPKADVQQATGRILRDRPADRVCQLRVVDIADDFSLFRGQARRRRAYYHACGYEVVDTGGPGRAGGLPPPPQQ